MFHPNDERALFNCLGVDPTSGSLPETAYELLREFTKLKHNGGRPGQLDPYTLLSIAHMVKFPHRYGGGRETPQPKDESRHLAEPETACTVDNRGEKQQGVYLHAVKKANSGWWHEVRIDGKTKAFREKDITIG